MMKDLVHRLFFLIMIRMETWMPTWSITPFALFLILNSGKINAPSVMNLVVTSYIEMITSIRPEKATLCLLTLVWKQVYMGVRLALGWALLLGM